MYKIWYILYTEYLNIKRDNASLEKKLNILISMESKLIYIYFIKSIKIETASAYDFKII